MLIFVLYLPKYLCHYNLVWTDEETEGLHVEGNELSEKVEKIEERLNELEKSLLKVRLKKCHIDEDPSRKTQKVKLLIRCISIVI